MSRSTRLLRIRRSRMTENSENGPGEGEDREVPQTDLEQQSVPAQPLRRARDARPAGDSAGRIDRLRGDHAAGCAILISSDYAVRVTLLRLLPSGNEALKPFGYDLFEGAPSTFAPVSDIQVPVGLRCGPRRYIRCSTVRQRTLELRAHGRNATAGSISRSSGPIIVSGMTFDAARDAIDSACRKQLIGTRVSVTMGDLRSIRVFVLGEAEKPGSYTVSGLSTMTNALFVERRRQEDRLAAQHRNSSATAAWSRRSTCTICCCTATPAATGSSCPAT